MILVFSRISTFTCGNHPKYVFSTPINVRRFSFLYSFSCYHDDNHTAYKCSTQVWKNIVSSFFSNQIELSSYEPPLLPIAENILGTIQHKLSTFWIKISASFRWVISPVPGSSPVCSPFLPRNELRSTAPFLHPAIGQPLLSSSQQSTSRRRAARTSHMTREASNTEFYIKIFQCVNVGSVCPSGSTLHPSWHSSRQGGWL